MGLGANILVTQIAWKAGHKALQYVPDNIKEFLTGNQNDGIMQDYIYENKGINASLTDSETYADITESQNLLNGVEGVSKTQEILASEKSQLNAIVEVDKNIGTMILNGNSNMFYLSGKQNYASMILRVQGQGDQFLYLPCVNGSPIIEMKVESNMMPIANMNEGATTNRRVIPKRFLFSFPISYLRIYNTNSANEKKSNTMGKLEKIKMRMQQAKKALEKAKNFDNPMGAFDNPSEGQARTILTFEEIYGEISNFHTQFGAWLYTGIGKAPKISVTANITLTAQKNDIDAVFVDIELIENMEFDYTEFKNTSTRTTFIGSYNATTQGESIPNGQSKV